MTWMRMTWYINSILIWRKTTHLYCISTVGTFRSTVRCDAPPGDVRPSSTELGSNCTKMPSRVKGGVLRPEPRGLEKSAMKFSRQNLVRLWPRTYAYFCNELLVWLTFLKKKTKDQYMYIARVCRLHEVAVLFVLLAVCTACCLCWLHCLYYLYWLHCLYHRWNILYKMRGLGLLFVTVLLFWFLL